jgi:hypothetical protein
MKFIENELNVIKDLEIEFDVRMYRGLENDKLYTLSENSFFELVGYRLCKVHREFLIKGSKAFILKDGFVSRNPIQMRTRNSHRWSYYCEPIKEEIIEEFWGTFKLTHCEGQAGAGNYVREKDSKFTTIFVEWL